MTLQELKLVKESLEECIPDLEVFHWGPSYELAYKRREKAIHLLTKEIREYFEV